MTDFDAVDFSKLDQSIENVCGLVDQLREECAELLAALKVAEEFVDELDALEQIERAIAHAEGRQG
jgi:hypothetical protein